MNGRLSRRYLRIPSIVITLATMVALRDALRWATDGAWIQNLPPDFQWLGPHAIVISVRGRLAITLALTPRLAWAMRDLAAGRPDLRHRIEREAAHLAGFNTAPAFDTFVVFAWPVG